MNRSLRTLSAIPAVALLISACSSKSPVTEDVLAQDSTLALAVMSANGDSITPRADDSLAAAIGAGTVTGPTEANSESSPKPVATANPALSGSANPESQRTERVAVAAAPRETRKAGRTSVSTGTRAVKVRRATKVATTSSQVPTPARAERRSTSSSSTTSATRMSALIPAGSDIELTSDDRVCASNSAVGETFVTRVAEDIVGPFGVVIPKGAIATAEVFTKRNDSRTNSASDVGIRIQSVTVAGRTYPIESLVTSSDITKVRRSRNDAGKVVSGAGLGAILGRVIGGDTRSTVIGAVGGAAAGAVVARQTGKVESCIPDGGRITARLTEPLRVAVTE